MTLMPLRIPDRLARRLIKAGKRPMDGARSAKAASVLDMPVQTTGFDALAGHTHMLLVTFKRDGSAVPTPVWFARDGDRVYVWTEINAYKAKRVRRDPRALIAPCGHRLAHHSARRPPHAGACSPTTANAGTPPPRSDRNGDPAADCSSCSRGR
jgi:pyridoxamine 5'-phosphate oxidase-like protein